MAAHSWNSWPGAMCQGHSLPFSRSGESPGVPDCGLCLSSFALCQQLVAIMALLNSLLQKRTWINCKRPLPLRFSKFTDQARTPFPYSPACCLPSYFLSQSLWSGYTSFCTLLFHFPDYDLKPDFSKASTWWFPNNLPGAAWHLCEPGHGTAQGLCGQR